MKAANDARMPEPDLHASVNQSAKATGWRLAEEISEAGYEKRQTASCGHAVALTAVADEEGVKREG
jgi:hypothetical protein